MRISILLFVLIILLCGAWSSFGQTTGVYGSSTGCQYEQDGTNYNFLISGGCSKYTWDAGSGGQIISGSGTSSVRIRWTTSGSKSVYCGCTTNTFPAQLVERSLPVTVTPAHLISVTPSSSTITYGQQITLTASGGSSFSWTGPGLSNTTGTQVTATPGFGSENTYTATETNPPNGYCAGHWYVKVTANNLPDKTYCKSGQIDLNTEWGVSGGSWRLDNVNLSGSIVDLSTLSIGTHVLNFSSSLSEDIILTVVESVAGQVTVSSPTVCLSSAIPQSITVNSAGTGSVVRWEKFDGETWNRIDEIVNGQSVPVTNNPMSFTVPSTATNPIQFRATMKNGQCDEKTTPANMYAQVTPIVLPTGVHIAASSLNITCTSLSGSLVIKDGNDANYSGSVSGWRRSTDGNNYPGGYISGSNGITLSDIFETSKVWFKAVINISGCDVELPAVSFEPSGAIAGNLGSSNFNRTCGSATGTLQIDNAVGTITWKKSRDKMNWQVIAGQVGSSIPLENFVDNGEMQATYYQVEVSKSSCPTASSNIFEALVSTQGGSATSVATSYCVTASGTIDITADAVGLIKRWEYADVQAENWTPITGSEGTKPLSYVTTVSRRYRAVLQLESCPEKYSSPIIINVTSLANPGVVRMIGEQQDPITVDGFTTFYPIFQLQDYGAGTIQNWWKYPQTGSPQNIANTTPTLQAGSVTATSTFSAQVKNGVCDALESGKAIFVINKPKLGVTLLSALTTLTEYNGYSYQVKSGGSIVLKTGFTYIANRGQDFFVLLDDEASIPPSDQNYVLEENILVENLTEDDVFFANASQKQSSITYMDGLGRTTQQVQRRASPSEKDMVVPVTYDVVGRVDKAYLPYVDAGSDGNYKATAVANQAVFYSPLTNDVHTKIAATDYPYSVNVYEASPLNRVLETGAPGFEWQPGQGHTVKSDYAVNQGGEAIKWGIDGSTQRPVNLGSYDPGSLLVKITIDEHGREVREYGTKQGLSILKKVQNSSTWNETYYIYDDFDLLRFVIQPEGINQLSGNPNQAFLDKWSFQYKYDERKRIIEKRVPGANWLYMVYDKRDRVVLTQDGRQRVNNQWSFIKHDAFSRPVMTGIYTYNDPDNSSHILSREEIKALVTGSMDESYNDVASTFGYTNMVFPTTSIDVLTVTYYDDYEFIVPLDQQYSYDPGALEGLPMTNFTEVKGLTTGAQLRVLGTPTWIKTVTFFDNHYRPIQSITSNHLGGTDRSSTSYDFSGKVMSRAIKHEQGPITKLKEDFAYDHAGRLLSQTHKTNDGPSVLLKSIQYNELGQLIEKNLHQKADGTFIQSVDYRYNVRGWLISINNAALTNDGEFTNDESSDWFGMELKYNNPLSGTAQYNGNISAIAWKGAGQSQQGYTFQYDHLNRLTQAVYKDTDLPVRNGRYNETISGYDKNGNILALQRSGRITENVYGTIDNLSYTYSGNQLMSVNETNSNATKGFIDGNTSGNDYDYDANGNTEVDKNKDIASITYNHLNLTDWITKTNGDRIKYTYNASGTKLNQQVYKGNVATPEKVSDYLGPFFMENGVLKFINHDEGRVIMKGSAVEYQYFLKDHLGNVRTTFTTVEEVENSLANNENNNATVEQANYLNYGKGRYVNSIIYDHTYDGNSSPPSSVRALRLTGGGDKDRVGLARSLSVMPGDKINIEVFAKYYEPIQGDNSGFAQLMGSIISGIGVPANTLIDGIAYSTGTNASLPFTAPGKDDVDPVAPKAFLNWLVFDKDDQIDLARSSFKQITTHSRENGTNVPHDRLAPDEEIVIKEAGLMYIWLSNENPASVEVYFDDFKITHTKSPIVQQEDYYPFGLAFNSSTRENSTKNNYLYNGKELQDELDLGWVDYGARMYITEIGRWEIIDRKADMAYDLTPYRHGFNNPIRFVDPDGNYETDGHFWTVYLAATLTEKKHGYDPYGLAYFAESPDHVMNERGDVEWATNTWFPGLGKQYSYHALGGESRYDEAERSRSMYGKAGSLMDRGVALHRLGDSYAHSREDNSIFSRPAGHVRRMEVDKIAARPDLYLEYVFDLIYTLGGNTSTDMFTFEYVAKSGNDTQENSAIFEAEVRLREGIRIFSVLGDQANTLNGYINARNNHYESNTQIKTVVATANKLKKDSKGVWVETNETETRTFVIYD